MFHNRRAWGALNRPVAGPPAWSPLDLPNLIGWYKADTGVTTSSGNVTNVTDQSTAGHNLVNSGTVPLASTFNGHPAFDFAVGNAAALYCSGFAMGTPVKASVIIAGQMDAATANYGGAVVYGRAGADDYSETGSCAFLTRNATNAEIACARAAAQTSMAMTTGAPHRMAMVCRASGHEIVPYVDNVPASSPGSDGLVSFISGGTLVIGNRWIGGAIGGGTWDGPIAEIIVCAVELNQATHLDVADAYLVAKYGI